MSRLDPLRERQEFIEGLEAKRERSSAGELRPPARNIDPPRAERPPQPSPASERSRPEFSLEDSDLFDRNHVGGLRDSEIRTLVDLGKVRVVAVADLAHLAYGGRSEQAQQDLQNLLRQELIRKDSFAGPEHTSRELLTLTKRGYEFVRESHMVPRNQVIYHGLARARDANHDVDLYKLYRRGLLHVAKEGGRNPRVILDLELIRKINQDIAKLGRDARPEIARHHGLRMVGNRIPVPDVRIEYEQPDGQLARIDLELLTEHYRGPSLADKVKAGFSLYTPRGEAGRLRRILDGHELTAEIFSL